MSDLWWNYGEERHRIVYIEYHGRHCFAVITELHWDHTKKPWFKPGKDKPTGTCAAFWDFEYSKRCGLWFHQTGSGGDPLVVNVGQMSYPNPPPATIWCAEDVVLTKWTKRKDNVPIKTDAELLRRGFKRTYTPKRVSLNGRRSTNPFEIADESSSSFVYCRVCKEHFPDDMECDHVEWCDDCGSMVNSNDRTVCDDEKSKCPHGKGQVSA